MSDDSVMSVELMKSFNITKKYFKDVFAYVYCPICQEIVSVGLDKNAIRSGLQTGLFIHRYLHTNDKYDPEDSEDQSNKEHTCAIYIDSNYDVRGVLSWFGKEPSSEDIQRGTRIPIVVKDIPPMSVHLGMLSPKEFKILQLCDGNNSVEVVSEIAGIDMKEFDGMLDKLKQKGLVNIVIRG
jgi:hypothetical protein